MNISSSRDRWKEQFAEGKGESVAHSIDKHVRHKKVEGIVGNDEGAQGLPEKGHVWVHAAENILARREIEQYDRRRVELDVESGL